MAWLRPKGAQVPPPGWRAPEDNDRGGVLVRTIGRGVRWAEGLSPGNRLSRPWRDHARSLVDERGQTYARLRAARIVDGWIMLCITIELLGLVLDAPAIRAIATVFAVLRLAEIAAVWAYAVLYESTDYGSDYNVVSLPRSLIHAVVMLGEVVLCFALIANFARGHIAGLDTGGDAVDYSMRTLATVGPSQTASGVVRYVVDIEPFVGLLFAATVVARLIGGVPQMSGPRSSS
jgi:hypothetical protein